MDISQLTANLEEINGRPLEPEEQQELVIWERGKTLLAIPPHAQIEIQQMLEGYVRPDADALLATDPANKDEVLAKHAVAHASAKNLVRFSNDFAEAVNAAQRTPEVLKRGIRSMQGPVDGV